MPVNAAISVTESFETNGEGSRYRSNQFDNSNQDYIGEYTAAGASFTSSFTGLDGTMLWGGEDLDSSSNPLGSGERGYLILNNIDISGGENNFIVDILLGARGDADTVGNGDSRFEADDELLIQYAIDGNIAGAAVNSGSYTTIGAFYGNLNGLGSSDLAQDTDLDGAANAGTFALTEALANYQFNFSGVTGSNLSIRIVMGQNTGSEDIALDNIRVNGSTVMVPEPSSVSLLGLGVLGLTLRRSRSMRKH